MIKSFAKQFLDLVKKAEINAIICWGDLTNLQITQYIQSPSAHISALRLIASTAREQAEVNGETELASIFREVEEVLNVELMVRSH